MLPTTNGSIRLFKVFGITVYLHWLWFLLLGFHWMNAKQYSDEPWWHVAVFVALFVIVLLHEFGHALACKSVGGKAERIVLWPLGGVAYVQPPPRPGAHLWSIAAGPLVNVVLAPILVAAYALVGNLDALTQNNNIVIPQADGLTFFLWEIMVINFLLLIFNMLPIYPLDGGQIVQSILWFFIGPIKALRISAGLGLACAIGLEVWFVTMQMWWLVLIAVFAGFQAVNGLRVARAMDLYQRQQGWGRPPGSED